MARKSKPNEERQRQGVCVSVCVMSWKTFVEKKENNNMWYESNVRLKCTIEKIYYIYTHSLPKMWYDMLVPFFATASIRFVSCSDCYFIINFERMSATSVWMMVARAAKSSEMEQRFGCVKCFPHTIHTHRHTHTNKNNWDQNGLYIHLCIHTIINKSVVEWANENAPIP